MHYADRPGMRINRIGYTYERGMRVNIEIDDGLLNEAMAATG